MFIPISTKIKISFYYIHFIEAVMAKSPQEHRWGRGPHGLCRLVKDVAKYPPSISIPLRCTGKLLMAPLGLGGHDSCQENHHNDVGFLGN